MERKIVKTDDAPGEKGGARREPEPDEPGTQDSGLPKSPSLEMPKPISSTRYPK